MVGSGVPVAMLSHQPNSIKLPPVPEGCGPARPATGKHQRLSFGTDPLVQDFQRLQTPKTW